MCFTKTTRGRQCFNFASPQSLVKESRLSVETVSSEALSVAIQMSVQFRSFILSTILPDLWGHWLTFVAEVSG